MRWRNRGFWWWVGLVDLLIALGYSFAGDTAHQALWFALAALAGVFDLQDRIDG